MIFVKHGYMYFDIYVYVKFWIKNYYLKFLNFILGIMFRLPIHSSKIQFLRKFASSKFGSKISAAPSTTTGIENALQHNERVKRNAASFKNDYKCFDYLNFHQQSYYDTEMELQKFRCAQPSPKKAEIEPKVKTEIQT